MYCPSLSSDVVAQRVNPYRFLFERPLSDLVASRLLWFSETVTHRIPEGIFSNRTLLSKGRSCECRWSLSGHSAASWTLAPQGDRFCQRCMSHKTRKLRPRGGGLESLATLTFDKNVQLELART